MPTTKKRLNISLSPEMEKAINKLAKRDQVPEATKAGELIRIAIEIEEDRIWDAIATERLEKGEKIVAHEEAWKK